MNDNRQGHQDNQSGQQGQDKLNQDMQDRYNQGYSNQSPDQGQRDVQGQAVDPNQKDQLKDAQGQPLNQEAQGPLDGARQMAGNQIDQAIDQFAKKIPGGEQQKQRAKDAANNILDQLEKQGENLLGGLGGIFGKRKDP